MTDRNDQLDPLDELLAQAHWPDTPAESTARLRAQWAAISPARRMRPKRWALAGAAAVLLACGIVWIDIPKPRLQIATPTATHSITPAVYPSRAMTERDRLLLRMNDLRTGVQVVPRESQAALLERLKRAPVDQQPAIIESIAHVADAGTLIELAEDYPAHRRPLLIAALRRGGSVHSIFEQFGATAVGAFLEVPPAARQRVLNALFAELEAASVETRLRAARILAAIDGPETVSRLARMIDRNVSRREAIAALVWSSRHSADAARLLEQARRSPRLASSIRAVELTL